MSIFTDNHKTIKEINSMFEKGSLIVDDSYQRRSVWGEKDKIRLIETILLGLVIPELFFWQADTNPDTGESITHIVDGQQRIRAICAYINNEFKLKTQYLLDDSIKAKCPNLYFKNLPPEFKTEFWNYRLMIIEIDPAATRDDIIKIFRRLNLTDFNLNDQEKRNSISGDFAVLAREISDMEFWDIFHLFNSTDIKRMKDVEFCASLILLYKQGIIDQTDQKALNQAYESLQSGYADVESDKQAICNSIDIVSQFIRTDDVNKFLKRKAQLYTLFSVIVFMQRNTIPISDYNIANLEQFVKLYSVFDNKMDLTGVIDPEEKALFDKLKQYKLASSEGLNKHTNRMIRRNVMKDFLLDDKRRTIQDTLYEKMCAVPIEGRIEDPEE